MKAKIASIAIALTFVTSVAQSKVSFITDEFDIMLRTTPSMNSKIIKPLGTGTPLNVIIEDAGKAHSQVRLNDGTIGYVLTRFISPKPAAKTQLAKLEEQIRVLNEDPDQLKSKYVDLEANYSRLSQKFRGLIESNEKLESDLKKFKEDSGNVAGLSESKDRLETQVDQLIIQLDDVRIENEALKDNSEKKSWILGALTALFGVFLGWVFSKTGGKRRQW